MAPEVDPAQEGFDHMDGVLVLENRVLTKG
jgi:hypothetical protein